MISEELSQVTTRVVSRYLVKDMNGKYYIPHIYHHNAFHDVEDEMLKRGVDVSLVFEIAAKATHDFYDQSYYKRGN